MKNKWKLSFIPLICIIFFLLLMQLKDRNKVVYLLGENNINISSFCVNTICLDKKNGYWEVNGQPANLEAIDAFVKELQRQELGVVASTNESNFDKLGVNTNSPVIKVNNIDIKVGALGPTFESTYVQINNNPTLYELPVLWGNKDITKLDYWRKMYVVNVSPYQLTKVKVTRQDGQVVVLQPENGKWKNDSFVQAASYVKNISYLGTRTPEKTTVVETIELTQEQEVTLYTLGKSELGKGKYVYWAQLQDEVFEIDPNTFNVLTSLK